MLDDGAHEQRQQRRQLGPLEAPLGRVDQAISLAVWATHARVSFRLRLLS